jgi:hypothetical protein
MNFEYTGYPEMYILENFTRDLINLESYKKFIRTFVEKNDNKEVLDYIKKKEEELFKDL